MMRKLWVWMAAWYGHRWATALGETFGESGPAGQIWSMGLADFSEREFGVGMLACADREEDWPPSLREFRTLCRPPEREPGDAWKRAKADPRMMPSPERLKWQLDNIDWIAKGGELPRPGVEEPLPPPYGAPRYGKD